VLAGEATRRYHRSVECTFCKILEGLVPSWRVYEDESSVAFLDKGQVTRGHTLVVPRRHAEDIWALSDDEACAVMRSVHRVSHLLRERLGLLGLNVTQANGRAAWQDVFHYHVHLIPRYGDDEFRPPWRSSSPSQAQLSDVQQQILQKETVPRWPNRRRSRRSRCDHEPPRLKRGR
jgi:histidine triad (HIT) family protein